MTNQIRNTALFEALHEKRDLPVIKYLVEECHRNLESGAPIYSKLDFCNMQVITITKELLNIYFQFVKINLFKIIGEYYPILLY